jgi:hypothetical protein
MASNSTRSVSLRCFICGRPLRFLVANNVVVETEGIIACNVPCSVCYNCADVLVDRLPDPPGIVCIDRLSRFVCEDLLESLPLIWAKSDAIAFFQSLFPELSQ